SGPRVQTGLESTCADRPQPRSGFVQLRFSIKRSETRCARLHYVETKTLDHLGGASAVRDYRKDDGSWRPCFWSVTLTSTHLRMRRSRPTSGLVISVAAA